MVGNFNSAISKPGVNNDLTELLRALPALAKMLEHRIPASVTALKESVPITDSFGPYAPDLSATLRTFGRGRLLLRRERPLRRVAPVFPDFKLGSYKR